MFTLEDREICKNYEYKEIIRRIENYLNERR